ncbi:MAG TPA: hypothetical protein VNI52_03355 [Sphingobacteriaceae bacterium]|nr:hypothetical protein [Sphingobacteriaceae bacterium]
MSDHYLKRMYLLLCVFAFSASCTVRQLLVKRDYLFDGKTFIGWQGDIHHTWRIEDGALVGGSLTEKVPIMNLSVLRRAMLIMCLN